MLDFQEYQLAFTAHIRDPALHKKPAKVAEKRMAIYREIVFNNILGSVSACFPVCQACLGKRAWLKLVRAFFANHQATSPIFREIPQQFLQFLNSSEKLPKYKLPIYFGQLAHYEWVELAVASQQPENLKLSVHIQLLDEKPMLVPAHMLLAYDYPVHKISARYKPSTPEQTYLLVFRNKDHQVKFIESNSMTFNLLNLINEKNLTGRQALTRLAEAINHPDVNAVIAFGAEILSDLVRQQAIIGSVKTSAKA